MGATVLALLASVAQAQLVEAPAAPATIVGRVCADLDGDGACAADEPPLAGVSVRTAQGLVAVTDAAGRFHLADPARRSPAETAGGLRVERLPQVALVVDPASLGPGAKPPPPVWVDLVPGSVARVVLPVRLPERPALPEARSGAAVGTPVTRPAEAGLVYEVPLEVGAGHVVQVDGRAVPVDAAGTARVPVPVSGRESAAVVTDRAPDGRLRILRQVVLRVPRRVGGDLMIARPLRGLATVALPPPGVAVAPGGLRVAIEAAPGTRVAVGPADVLPAMETVPAEGRRVTQVVVPADGRLQVYVAPPGEHVGLAEHAAGDGAVAAPPVVPANAVRVEVSLPVDPAAGDHWLLAADLRVGGGDGVFVDGRLAGSGRFHAGGGVLTAGLDLSDGDVADLLDGGPLLQVQRPSVVRWPDPDEVGAVFGDASQTLAANPAGLNLYGDWTGPAGRAGFGAGRTGLAGAEVGRFDRPVAGPYARLSSTVGPVTLGLEGGADASGLPVAEHTGWVPARAVLAATGGAVYWLPRRDVVPGSERLWVEAQDPLTGLPASRRLLVRGVDYDLDYPSGRVLLAAPLGDVGLPPVGRLAATGLGWETRLVADYAFRAAPGERDPALASSGARASIAAAGVEVGLRGAAVNAGRYGLLGVDVTAEPAPWLSVAASAAMSDGLPYRGARAFAWSRDAGLSWLSAPVDAEAEGTGLAVRARLGSVDNGVTGWWVERDEGFADGAGFGVAARQRGGLARATLGPVRLSLLGNERTGAAPWLGAGGAGSWPAGSAGPVAEASGVEVAGRVETDVGPVTLAAEGLHRRTTLAGVEGAVTAAGLEAEWHLAPRFDVLVGHLQQVAAEGEGPGAADPTFTSAGVRARGTPLGTLEVRGGVHPDLTPAVDARWYRAEVGGRAAYGTFAVRTDGPWTRQGVSSVSGARDLVAPGVTVFAEERAVDDPLEGPRAGTALGGELREGPWRLGASWERGRRLVDGPEALREAVHAQVGLAGARGSVSAFGETVRTPPTSGTGFVRVWSAGLAANVNVTDALSVGGRLLASDAPVLAGAVPDPAAGPRVDLPPAVEALAGASWRPRAPFAPALLLHYGLVQEGTGSPALDVLAVPRRRHLVRAAAMTGDAAGLDLRVTLLGAVNERLEADAPPPAWAGVASARAGYPVLGYLEPAVELGVRQVGGAGLAAETDATARVELLLRLGALRLGAGVVLAGFAGSGVEGVSGEPEAPQVYAVLRGALQ